MIKDAILPYTDDFLKWDEATQKYYITEKALIKEGIDIRSRLSRNKANSPEYVLNGFIKRVTYEVYAFIHSHNSRTDIQDYFIAVCPSLREKIKQALIYQALFMWFNGDFLLSADKDKRENYLDRIAIEVLNEKVPELDNPITYRGEWNV